LFQPARANIVIEDRLRTGFDSDVVFLGGGFAKKKGVVFLREGAPGDASKEDYVFSRRLAGRLVFSPQR
jgi:hypothetical protein